MKSEGDILKKLSDIIVGYLNEKKIWSDFSDSSGTTRGAIVELFFKSNNNITSENIRERIICDISRDLSENELKRLQEIIDAWREWAYITEQTNNINRS